MASVYDETSNKTYDLIPDKSLVIGRLQVNDQDQRLSRTHVQITLLKDQRCFVKAMSRNLCTLDNAILPRKLNEQGKEEGQEVEAFNGQWIHLLPGKLYPLKLTLPKSMTSPTPRKPLMQHKSDNDETESDDDTDDENRNNNVKEQSDDSMDDDEENPRDELNATTTTRPEQDRHPSTPSSVISTESSLLGGESWSD